jgi:hypothetical protein
LNGFARIIEFQHSQTGRRILTLNEGEFKHSFFHGYGRSLNAVTSTCRVGYWNADIAVMYQRSKLKKQAGHGKSKSCFAACSSSDLGPGDLDLRSL